MKTKMPEPNYPIAFEISTSARDDGTIEAVYIYFSHNPVARTREIRGDILLADLDAQGNLVGIEILAPVKISELVPLVDPSRRMPFEKFMKRALPGELVYA